MKSFLTDLLVQLAVLSLCVNSSKLYFLHVERLVIFVITTLKICFFACRKATKEICVSDLWHLPKHSGFDGNIRLSTEDQVHATWLAHGCHMAQLPLSDQFT